MGLKRRNPARTRLFTPPQMLAALAATPLSAANVQARKASAPAESAIRPGLAVTGEERHRMIASAAYGHAERAGFGSDPVANWLAAEREIDARLARKAG